MGARITLCQSLRQCPSLGQAFTPPQDLAESLECQGYVMQTTARKVPSGLRMQSPQGEVFKAGWELQVAEAASQTGEIAQWLEHLQGTCEDQGWDSWSLHGR